MQTVLFHSTIFGPIHSRRLGMSLGINLMPNDGKMCSFDCLYCEAGFNAQGPGTTGIPSRETVKRLLAAKLKQMHEAGDPLDVITFSGNGEPTIHPQFDKIIHDVVMLRDRYYPSARVSVLSNATMCGRPAVAAGLRQADNNILKLDSAVPATFKRLNQPASPNVLPEGVIQDIKAFGDQCIVQTMLVRGSHDGEPVDNTTTEEIAALIEAYKEIKPREIMLYSIDRTPPATALEKVPIEELRRIGEHIEHETGIHVQVN